jgi:molybdenum cofactor cytidylyltransferase
MAEISTRRGGRRRRGEASDDRALGIIRLVNNRVFVTGLILAAGGSTRFGAPKQLLPYGDRTLLDHVLDTARGCHFDQLLAVIGGSADAIREQVDLGGVQVVENRHFGEGCSSSIATALAAIDPRADVLVLLLGDQPGVTTQTVNALVGGRGDSPLAACAYEDGRGHPLAFAREMFEELAALHGDKGVWKLLDRHAHAVVEVAVQGPIPRDVNTGEDYRAVLTEQEART